MAAGVDPRDAEIARLNRKVAQLEAKVSPPLNRVDPVESPLDVRVSKPAFVSEDGADASPANRVPQEPLPHTQRLRRDVKVAKPAGAPANRGEPTTVDELETRPDHVRGWE